ncbi:40S ribosomal protein S21 [Ancistrocladus abbreviatus]
MASSLSHLFSVLLPSSSSRKPPPAPKSLPPVLQFQYPPPSPALPSSSSTVWMPAVAASTESDSGSSEMHLSSSSWMSVVCPSLACANTLYFKSAAYNVEVVVDENEPEERLLNRFRREVMKAGIIQECKRRRFFENKQDERKRKSREAAKRNSRRRRPQSRGSSTQGKQEITGKPGRDHEDDQDNWELPPQGELPY